MMVAIDGFYRQQILADLEALAADPSAKLTMNQMQAHLGRDFSAYKGEAAKLEQFVPKDALSGYGQQYADKAQSLLTRITHSLNLKHISLSDETPAQLKRRQEFIHEAEQLRDEYLSNFEFDGQIGVEQPYLSDAQYLVSYDDAAIGSPYHEAYRALEGYHVFVAQKPEDSQINQTTTVNGLQRQYLTGLLAGTPEAETSEPSLLRSRLAEIKKNNT